jgi:hypothetical protein
MWAPQVSGSGRWGGGATAITPERPSQGRRPQTPQPPHPRPESRVGLRNHEAGRSLGPDPQDTGRSHWVFQQVLESVRTVRNSSRANQRKTEDHRPGVARGTGHGQLPDRAGSPRGVHCRPLHMRAPRTNHLASQHTVRGHDQRRREGKNSSSLKPQAHPARTRSRCRDQPSAPGATNAFTTCSRNDTRCAPQKLSAKGSAQHRRTPSKENKPASAYVHTHIARTQKIGISLPSR